MKDKLGCRSHMFEGSFFSARCAYKKLSELCAGTPNRHILNQAPRQTRMVSWLSAYGAHYAPAVKCVEVHLLEVFTWHLSNLSLYSTPSEPGYLPVCALIKFIQGATSEGAPAQSQREGADMLPNLKKQFCTKYGILSVQTPHKLV